MPEAGKPKRPAVDRREIRVFISSTFRDMQEEREELVKQIFPQLRRLCECRGVTWGEVDLRWGIPDEAKAEGKVLPLCLAEIEQCRPYFIGLLGERYGWVPEQIPEELIEAQPWLNEHRNQSVTALEILHGVLLNPKMAEHAFFFFRDPGYAASREGFTEEDPTRRERLKKLKDDIRKSGFPVSEPFATPKQLGEWVLRDLTAVIEKLCPESSIPDPLDRDAADHEAYSASRRRVYIGRQEYIRRLDAHAAGDEPPLVITGESGGGKSALLANWTHNWSERHPETPVLLHFIGAAPDSANWMAMLRRLLGEFKRRFNIQIEIPDQPHALRAFFVYALHMVAAHGRVVLVLDALNQIEDRDGAPDLVWLPPIIPANVRLIVSTLPGRPWDDLKKRGWPVMTVKPLTPSEREKLIVEYLAQYAKALSPERCRRVAAAAQTGNGLYLSTLLNELRLFGSHEELDKRIAWYLEAAAPFELYGKVIQRWEDDYGQPDRECENVVRESLERLWAARRGLSETELLESLGTSGAPLPRALWSPLYLAVGDALVNRGGLLTFAHEFLREAVRGAYLPADQDQQEAHHILSLYFLHQTPGPRLLDELPWQCQQSFDWKLLADMLAQPGFLIALWRKDQFEVKAYWTAIEAHSPLRMEEIYAPVIQDPNQHDVAYTCRVGQLLGDTGKSEAALRVWKRIMEDVRKPGDRLVLGAAICSQANLLYSRGDPKGATALYKESERIFRELGDIDGLQTVLGNQAATLAFLGDCDGAMALYDQKERICRESGNNAGLQSAWNGKATILQDRGDLNGAMVLCKQSEHICRELGDKDGLRSSLTNQANILSARGDLDAAMAVHKQSEHICRELGDKDGLHGSLTNQGNIFYRRGDLDGAMALHKQSELLGRELGSKKAIALSLGNQGAILQARGDLDGALALYKENEHICRELGDEHGLEGTLSNQALILSNRNDLNGALKLNQESERLCRELGDKEGLQRALGIQAGILYELGDRDAAIAKHKQQELLCRELGNFYGMSTSLTSQAFFLSEIPGRENEARRLAEEALAIAACHDDCKELVAQIQNLCEDFGVPHELNKTQSSISIQVPTPHPSADPNRAFQLNLRYQNEKNKWRELPWWRRLITPEPKPPTGV